MMKIFRSLNKYFFSEISAINNLKSVMILIAGLTLTAILTVFMYHNLENQVKEEFTSECIEIEIKITIRLHAHALILRSGAAFLSVTDTVTRKKWEEFNKHSQIERNLPGIQGVGFSLIIPHDQLEKHQQRIQQEGFPDYTVFPAGDRSIYSSIIFLEPFSGRNLRAFGFDMFSEPVRRKAMESARDNDIAMLSGKVKLVQETPEDLQFGTLMYVPVYRHGSVVNTVDKRKASIIGWVYSPYRMDDLMKGILGRWDKIQQKRIHLQVYDDSLSVSSILYDSQKKEPNSIIGASIRTLTIPVEFNGKKWVLLFTQSSDQVSIWQKNLLIIMIGGIIISFLLFFLSFLLFKIKYHAQQIKNQNDQLSQMNAEKDKFFSIIAHDLKSPFCTIAGFSERLVEQVKVKNYVGIEKYADIILKSARMTMDLQLNLMEWSQSKTGRLEYNPELFTIEGLIDELIQLLSINAELKSISIRKLLLDNTLVYADKYMIGTVLRNLITNAIKFTKQGGEIIISVTGSQNAHTISVKDTGIGISETITGTLFKIGQYYSTSGTENEKGTGLGLIICKEFVEKHGGKIWVESKEGEGTRFSFTIPGSAKS
jgi:signal transduction histidine kinase